MIIRNQYKKLKALNGCTPMKDLTSNNIKGTPEIIDACQNKSIIYLRVLIDDKEYIMEVKIRNRVEYISANNTLYHRGLVVGLNSNREYHALEILPDKTYIELYGENNIDTAAHSNCFCIVKDKFGRYTLIHNNVGYRLGTEQAKELSNYCYVCDTEEMDIRLSSNKLTAIINARGHEANGVIKIDLGEEIELEDIDCGVLYELK